MGFDKSKKSKRPKNRKTKKILVFDENARREYLTGFRKRKNERRKKAKDELKQQLKDEKKELKIKRREMLQKSMAYTGKKKKHDPAVDIEEFVKPEVVDLPDHTVTITDISDVDFSGQNGLRLGQNRIQEDEEETESIEDQTPTPVDNKSVKAIFRRENKEKHMRKVFGRHKVNYSHSMDKKFKMRHKQSGRRNKDR